MCEFAKQKGHMFACFEQCTQEVGYDDGGGDDDYYIPSESGGVILASFFSILRPCVAKMCKSKKPATGDSTGKH